MMILIQEKTKILNEKKNIRGNSEKNQSEENHIIQTTMANDKENHTENEKIRKIQEKNLLFR